MAIAQFTFSDFSPALLVLSTLGLYGGGVVMNDVFDARLDKVERPERPIPSGLVSPAQGTVLGVVLLTGGVLLAFFVSTLSGVLALVIAVAAIVYEIGRAHV